MPIIRDYFTILALKEIREIIDRPPIYRLTGYTRRVFSICNLRKDEAEKVKKFLEPEIDGYFITKIEIIKTVKEREPPAGYMFVTPDFTNAYEEEISEFNQETKNKDDIGVFRFVKVVASTMALADFE